MYFLLIFIPIIESLLFWTTSNRKTLHIINVAGSFLLLLTALYLTGHVQTNAIITYPFLNNIFYIDSLNVLVLDITVLVGFFVSVYSIGYMNNEYRQEEGIRKIKLFYSLISTFIFTMVLVATTQNLGLMWIAIEATTLASVFLVGFANTKRSLEAAWKYIIICSVGIALAFLGILFLYFSSHQVLQNAEPSLNWSFLYEQASNLDTGILKIAFIFVLVGFGTKAGLVPMHTWLPDAHSEAPSPVSALLSGVLLNNAMYGIIRFLAIVNKNFESTLYTGRLLIALGILSIGTAALFILAQKDYKRLLAYSSIEHMGIIALALGIFTPASLFASFFHMFNHSLTKAMLFLSAGNVLQRYKTKNIRSVSGLLQSMPLTGSVFLLGTFAIAGLPPFSIFSSELNITLATFTAGHSIVGAAFVLLIAFAFASTAYTLFRMFFGNSTQEQNNETNYNGNNHLGNIIILLLLTTITLTGFYMPMFMKTVFESATRIVTGG
jgi:hydrogenase-4 component F